jgi:3-methylfumaryl-CoA hydratase
MNLEPVDLSHLREWVGRSERVPDIVAPRVVEGLLATLDRRAAGPDTQVPATIHWCLTTPTAPMSAIGEDGHPRRGGFLPPVSLPRRMWAGGALQYTDRLRVGDEIDRVSTIADVVVKHGKSGTLCFVQVDHVISTPRGVAIRERQDIVYRDLDASGRPQTPAKPTEPRTAKWSRVVDPTPVLLFRYSALTFNGHRIHYDRNYCAQAEGYPGLVVHGPLQATLLMELATEARDGAPPRSFTFRGAQPLFDGAPFSVNAREAGAGLELWTQDAAGRQTMTASALW